MKEMGELEFREQEFNQFFNSFDKNGNGRINKSEMREFIKTVLLN